LEIRPILLGSEAKDVEYLNFYLLRTVILGQIVTLNTEES